MSTRSRVLARIYEMREIEILDPDGHPWCLGQNISGAAFASLVP